jgi:hypothetical protein
VGMNTHKFDFHNSLNYNKFDTCEKMKRKVSRGQQIKTLRKAIQNRWYPDKIFKQEQLLRILLMEGTIPETITPENNESAKLDSEGLSCIDMICQANTIYMETGCNSRSSKKVDKIHQWIENQIQPLLHENMKIKQEQSVPANTKSGKKKCDIVVYKDDKPWIIFPVKYCMTTYKKNAYNYWENIQGDAMQLKKTAADEGRELHIIPINIISNQTPNRTKDGLIKNMEIITYEESLKVYETLKCMPGGNMENISPLCMDVISYIIDVHNESKVGEKYYKCPTIIGFHKDTPYRTFEEILKPIIS